MLKLGKPTRLMLTLLAVTFGAATLAACDEGPLEKAGSKADEAVNDAKRAVKDAAD